MPTYQYECNTCGHGFEILQSMTDPKLKKCPECGKKALSRLIGSGAGVIFKGSGFYETDYKRKGTSGSDEKPSKTKTSAKDSPKTCASGHGSCACAAQHN